MLQSFGGELMNSGSGPLPSDQNSQSALLKFLFTGYDKRIRPFSEHHRPALIEMTIVLAILTELRENQQVASFVISHIQKWSDPRLVWNPDLFGGLRQIVVPQSNVWLPKLFIYNSMDTKDMLTENRFDLRIGHDGRLKVNIPQYVTCICRLNISLFPFDTQFCAIAQASPLLSVEEMDVNATIPPRDSYFSGNAEWELINVTVRDIKFVEDGEKRVEVHYIMHMRRRPIYYITVIVAPTFLISALSILGIFSPGENDGPRTEKVSLGLGSLLAMSVLLDIVSAAMPKSNSIPLLGYYIISAIMICAMGVALSTTLLAISRHLIGKGEIPSQMLYRYLWLDVSPTSRQKCYSSLYETKENFKLSNSNGHSNGELSGGRGERAVQSAGQQQQMPMFPDMLLAIHNQLQEIVKAQRAFRKKIERRKERQMVEREWNRVFSRFDYLFLFLFSMANLIILLMFLRFYWHANPKLPDNFEL